MYLFGKYLIFCNSSFCLFAFSFVYLQLSIHQLSFGQLLAPLCDNKPTYKEQALLAEIIWFLSDGSHTDLIYNYFFTMKILFMVTNFVVCYSCKVNYSAIIYILPFMLIRIRYSREICVPCHVIKSIYIHSIIMTINTHLSRLILFGNRNIFVS